MKVDILGTLSFISDLTPLILFLIFRKVLNNKESIILFIWTIISVSLDLMIIFGDQANIQKVAFYTIFLEPIVICLLYIRLAISKRLKRSLGLVIITFAIKSAYDFYNYNHNGFAYYMASVGALILLVSSLVIIMELLKSDDEILIFDLPIAYIYIGYIIYTAGTLFLFTTTEKFPNIFQSAGTWAIFAIANVLKNGFFVAYIIKKRNLIDKPIVTVDEENIPFSAREILKRYEKYD